MGEYGFRDYGFKTELSERIWGKPIEIAENWLQRFRMEGGAEKHLRFSEETGGNFCRNQLLPFAFSLRALS